MMNKYRLFNPFKTFLIEQDKYHTLKKFIPPGLKAFLQITKYNFWLAYITLTKDSDRKLLGDSSRSHKRRRRILFYPDLPWQNAVIYQICLVLGYKITNNVHSPFDLAIKWKNTTIDQSYPSLHRLAESKPVVNLNCIDISKATVEAVFEDAFGYNLAVDPREYTGKCVRKSNLNSSHNGEIIDCPIDEVDPESVYQILIDNRYDGGRTVDLRVPIFGEHMPYVSYLIRPIQNRFDHFRFTGDNYKIEKVSKVFTPQERRKIQLFCKQIGLEYGELDILRNNTDGRIYIVDANNTPDGPPIHVGLEGEDLRRQTLLLRARSFEKIFLGTRRGEAFAE